MAVKAGTTGRPARSSPGATGPTRISPPLRPTLTGRRSSRTSASAWRRRPRPPRPSFSSRGPARRPDDHGFNYRLRGSSHGRRRLLRARIVLMAQGHWRRGSIATATFAAVLVSPRRGGRGMRDRDRGATFPTSSAWAPRPAECPGNQVCDTKSSHQCVAPCSLTGCKGGTQLRSDLEPVRRRRQRRRAHGRRGSLDDGRWPRRGRDARHRTRPRRPRRRDRPRRLARAGASGARAAAAPIATSGICADQLSVTSGVLVRGRKRRLLHEPVLHVERLCAAGSVCFATAAGRQLLRRPELGAALDRRSARAGRGNAAARAATAVRDCAQGTTCADTCCSTGQASASAAAATSAASRTFPGAVAFDKNYVAWCGHGGQRPERRTAAATTATARASFATRPSSATARNACRNTADCGGAAVVSCAYVTVTGRHRRRRGVLRAAPATRPRVARAQQRRATARASSATRPRRSAPTCASRTPTARSRAGAAGRRSSRVRAAASYSVLACGT